MVTIKLIFVALFLFNFIGCSSTQHSSKIQIPKLDIPKKEDQHNYTAAKVEPELKIDIPQINPLELKRISLNLRASPLKDVLYVIARDAGLNLIIERDVDQDFPVTVILSNVTLQDALDYVMSSTDYFYKIERNILRVSATETKTFWLDVSATTRTYSIDIGGDILGAGAAATGGGSNLRGNVAKTEKSDDDAYNIWSNIERAISAILAEQTPQITTVRQTQPQGQQQPQQTTTVTPSVASAEKPTEYYVINRLTGSIMVKATKRKLEKIEKYLNDVKAVLQRQVLIEARIIEVQLSDTQRYGIDWNLLFEKVIKTVPVRLSLKNNKFTDIIPPLSDLPFSQFDFTLTTGSIREMSGVIKALSEFGDVRTLSNPRISVMNGQPAVLTVGTNFSFISRVTLEYETDDRGNRIPRYTPERSSILSGIMLGIVPYVDGEGNITLTITPILSNLIDIRERTFGGLNTRSETIQLPIVDLRQLSTNVRVKDGEVVILGGLISGSENLEERKTPLLGDVPGLGLFFKSKKSEVKSSELVILLQPRIISK